LAEVICQLRFTRLLRIENEAPAAFQDELRASYPEVRESAAVSAPIPPEIVRIAGIDPGALSRAFDFCSEDGAWRVSLTSHFLALTANEYEDWAEFRRRFVDVLHALVHIYKVTTFTRAGLRYRDVIQRSKLDLGGAKWSELLRDELLGELKDPPVEVDAVHAARELVLRLDSSADKVRLYHGFAQVQGNDETCYLIDADFFREGKTNEQDAVASLDRFNREAGNLFRWCIRDPLHRAMEPTEPGGKPQA
jgi:uncharacterized protein (TIGR04255 family)